MPWEAEDSPLQARTCGAQALDRTGRLDGVRGRDDAQSDRDGRVGVQGVVCMAFASSFDRETTGQNLFCPVTFNSGYVRKVLVLRRKGRFGVNNIIYIVGLVVVVIAVLSFFGLR